MSVTVEKKENNMAVLTIEVPADEFVEALEKAYLKQKGRITLPGFRKGKAPRKMIQKMYGAAVFFEEAANILLQSTYDEAAKESGEQIVSRPQVNITQIEEGKPFIYTATVALKPEVQLGQYKGVEIPKKEVTVSEEEIRSEIDRELDQNARDIDVDDRPVQDGDRIMITDEGSEMLTYQVYGNYKIAADDFISIAGDLQDNSLVLITCEDETLDGTYQNRRVIFAH